MQKICRDKNYGVMIKILGSQTRPRQRSVATKGAALEDPSYTRPHSCQSTAVLSWRSTSVITTTRAIIVESSNKLEGELRYWKYLRLFIKIAISQKVLKISIWNKHQSIQKHWFRGGRYHLFCCTCIGSLISRDLDYQLFSKAKHITWLHSGSLSLRTGSDKAFKRLR